MLATHTKVVKTWQQRNTMPVTSMQQRHALLPSVIVE